MSASRHAQPRATLSADVQLRPLTEEEIARLERVLGKPVERQFLVHWVSQAIRDVVMMPTQPTLRECRDSISKLVRHGRQWIEQVESCSGKLFLEQGTNLDELTSTVLRFCNHFENTARELRAAVRPGHPRIPFILTAFLDRMIGIAKKAKVLPSTPGRALRSQTAPRLPPAFFRFVLTALAVGRDVIGSSPLPEDRRKMALATLRVQSDEALSKLLEQLRGAIGRYRQTEHGLVES